MFDAYLCSALADKRRQQTGEESTLENCCPFHRLYWLVSFCFKAKTFWYLQCGFTVFWHPSCEMSNRPQKWSLQVILCNAPYKNVLLERFDVDAAFLLVYCSLFVIHCYFISVKHGRELFTVNIASITKRIPLIKHTLHPFVSRISRVMELFSSPIIFIWEIRYYYKQSNSNSSGKDVMLYEHSIIPANLRH